MKITFESPAEMRDFFEVVGREDSPICIKDIGTYARITCVNDCRECWRKHVKHSDVRSQWKRMEQMPVLPYEYLGSPTATELSQQKMNEIRFNSDLDSLDIKELFKPIEEYLRTECLAGKIQLQYNGKKE